jgi:hypothetical protein
MRNELDPEDGPPPREVYPWTHVVGHVIVRVPGRRSFCDCGWSYTGEGDHRVQVDEHKRTAWPRLIPRLPDETRAQWRDRVAVAHDEALLAREALWVEERLDGPTPPGHAFAVPSTEYCRADDLVTVLEWQLSQIPRGPEGT